MKNLFLIVLGVLLMATGIFLIDFSETMLEESEASYLSKICKRSSSSRASLLGQPTVTAGLIRPTYKVRYAFEYKRMTHEASYKTKVKPLDLKQTLSITHLYRNPQINFVGNPCKVANKYKSLTAIGGKKTINMIGRGIPILGLLLTMVGLFGAIYNYIVRRKV